MLQCLHCSAFSPGDPSDDIERQVGDEAQHDDLALIVRQLRERRHELGIQRFGWWWSRGVRQLTVDLFGSTGPAPVLIDEPVSRDGEDPSSQVVAIATKAGKIASYLEENLTEKILGIASALGPQITEYRRSQVAISDAGVRRPGLAHQL